MKALSLFVFVIFAPPAFADADTEAAIKAVQEQMKDPKFHQEAGKTSKEAATVEKNVSALAGSPENEQAMYNLAADVLGNMKNLTPEQMKDLLQKAQENPELFFNSWTPEQKKQLKELSGRIPAGKALKP